MYIQIFMVYDGSDYARMSQGGEIRDFWVRFDTLGGHNTRKITAECIDSCLSEYKGINHGLVD